MMATQPLNIVTVKAATKGAQQYVQDEKIRISRVTITKFQYGDRWPDEDYLSYVGTLSKKNEYKDPERFFWYMHKSPQLYARRFTFLPESDVDERFMREAILYAWNIIYQKSLYFRVTGRYEDAFRFIARKGATTTKTTQISKLPDAPPGTSYEIINTIAYASRLETLALYGFQQQGIMWYAAKKTQKKYPTLTVSFDFARPENYGVSHLPNDYMIPRIRIGRRQDVSPKMKRPGNRYNRRRRSARKLQRLRRGR